MFGHFRMTQESLVLLPYPPNYIHKCIVGQFRVWLEKLSVLFGYLPKFLQKSKPQTVVIAFENCVQNFEMPFWTDLNSLVFLALSNLDDNKNILQTIQLLVTFVWSKKIFWKHNPLNYWQFLGYVFFNPLSILQKSKQLKHWPLSYDARKACLSPLTFKLIYSKVKPLHY